MLCTFPWATTLVPDTPRLKSMAPSMLRDFSDTASTAPPSVDWIVSLLKAELAAPLLTSLPGSGLQPKGEPTLPYAPSAEA